MSDSLFSPYPFTRANLLLSASQPLSVVYQSSIPLLNHPPPCQSHSLSFSSPNSLTLSIFHLHLSHLHLSHLTSLADTSAPPSKSDRIHARRPNQVAKCKGLYIKDFRMTSHKHINIPPSMPCDRHIIYPNDLSTPLSPLSLSLSSSLSISLSLSSDLSEKNSLTP